MVELRWIERPSQIQAADGPFVRIERALQSRKVLAGAISGPSGVEIRPALWTEWADVPVVQEL